MYANRDHANRPTALTTSDRIRIRNAANAHPARATYPVTKVIGWIIAGSLAVMALSHVPAIFGA